MTKSDSLWIHWISVDLFWAIGGGFAIGLLTGKGIGKLVVYLRTKLFETESLDDFLAIGLIGITYGLAALVHTYGFLAVFRFRAPPVTAILILSCTRQTYFTAELRVSLVITDRMPAILPGSLMPMVTF